MNTLLAILQVTDERRDVILAGGLYHRFTWRHLPPTPPSNYTCFFKYEIFKLVVISAYSLAFRGPVTEGGVGGGTPYNGLYGEAPP